MRDGSCPVLTVASFSHYSSLDNVMPGQIMGIPGDTSVLCSLFSDHFRAGERPLKLDLDRDLDRAARREPLRPSHGSPGPEILICGIGAGGSPLVLSRARLHFSTGIRLSPCRTNLSAIES